MQRADSANLSVCLPISPQVENEVEDLRRRSLHCLGRFADDHRRSVSSADAPTPSDHVRRENYSVETVGAVAITFVPILAMFFLGWKTIRKTMFGQRGAPVWPEIPKPGPPLRPPDLAGDREPRRPLQPSLAGAAALPIPEVLEDDAAPNPQIALPRPVEPGSFGIAS